MRFLRPLLVLVTALAVSLTPSRGQPPRVSPHETISRLVDGNRITIVYGRPYSRDAASGQTRKIWGGLVPYGHVWRTGADEATLFITEQPIDLGGTWVAPGAYTLFTQLETNGSAKLILSKQIGQWGLQYDPKQDFARIPLKRESLDAPVDQFQIAIDKDFETGIGMLRLIWENTQYTIPFTVRK